MTPDRPEATGGEYTVPSALASTPAPSRPQLFAERPQGHGTLTLGSAFDVVEHHLIEVYVLPERAEHRD
jgi:hypothetical protein